MKKFLMSVINITFVTGVGFFTFYAINVDDYEFVSFQRIFIMAMAYFIMSGISLAFLLAQVLYESKKSAKQNHKGEN